MTVDWLGTLSSVMLICSVATLVANLYYSLSTITSSMMMS